MRRLSIATGLILSLGMLTFTIQPVLAASKVPTRGSSASLITPNAVSICHADGNFQVIRSASEYFNIGYIEVYLLYCPSAKSNFARAYWYPFTNPMGPGTPLNGATLQVHRQSGPDGGAATNSGIVTINPGGSADTAILYSPHNLDNACVGYPGTSEWLCTAFG